MSTQPSDGTSPERPRGALPPRIEEPAFDWEESAVLGDFREAAGMLLWQSVRDLNLWALAPQRDGLFARETYERREADVAALRGELRPVAEPLHALLVLLDVPSLVDVDVIHRAAWQISEWAEAQGALGTALAYALAAVRVKPERRYDPRVAYRVGKLLRQRGRYARAERWLKWAIAIARRRHDHEMHASGWEGLGSLYHIRGAYPRAARCYMRFLRLARRHSLHKWEGQATHSLFTVYAEMDEVESALDFALEAADVYRKWCPSMLPTLAHDTAVLWNSQGHFDRALLVLEAVWERVRPERRSLALSNLVRAAGGLGARETFEDYWGRTLAEMSEQGAIEMQPQVLLNLCRGAASLREWDRAKRTGEEALRLAKEVGEHHVRLEAEALLEAIDDERSSSHHREPPLPRQEGADRFARELRDHFLTAAGR